MSIEEFHAHLESCCQCANEPFNLCPIGAKILSGAAESKKQ